VAIAEKHSNETADQIVTRFGRFGTIDLRVDYLHQGIGRSFHASGKVIRLGGRIASVQMELKNDDDLLIATGTAAYVIS
jgi:acyl-coenzyme A thioesterase PaaI-like protein